MQKLQMRLDAKRLGSERLYLCRHGVSTSPPSRATKPLCEDACLTNRPDSEGTQPRSSAVLSFLFPPSTWTNSPVDRLVSSTKPPGLRSTEWHPCRNLAGLHHSGKYYFSLPGGVVVVVGSAGALHVFLIPADIYRARNAPPLCLSLSLSLTRGPMRAALLPS